MHCIRRILPLVSLVLLLVDSHSFAAPVQLSSDGAARLPIVLGPALSDEPVATERVTGYGQADVVEVASSKLIRDAVEILASYLERISGSSFETTTGDGRSGIAIGLFSDFPSLDLDEHFDAEDILRTEEYLIRSHENGLYVIGASELAVQHAVWDLLHRLGHRQFFPGEKWEFVPEQTDLAIDVDAFEKPDYHSRLIWSGGGTSNEQDEAYARWCAANRAVAGFRVNTSHEYNSIRKRNSAAFEANPEFYAMVDGEHKAANHAKFNVASEGLRQLVIEDALRWFDENPHAVSKSMDPSDFGGWSKEGPSADIGSPTDQALTLANLVAEAANDRLKGDRYVGMYAYYDHQQPPNIEIHPHVIISFATRFLKPGLTVEDLIAGWREQGLQQFGVREYYGVFIWEWDVPSLAVQGGSIDYLTHTIPAFHRDGARFLTAEASSGMGTYGLGYYLASRMLWDTGEASDVDALVDDFLDKAFGPAREPMQQFYSLINGDNRPQLRDGMIGQLYNLLVEAGQLAHDDENVQSRLDDLVLFVRYLELMHAYEQVTGDERQQAFEALVRHGYRMRGATMVHLHGLYTRGYLARQDPNVAIPDEAAWDVPESDNPWKSSEPFSDAELTRFVQEGVQRHEHYLHQRPAFVLDPSASQGKATRESLPVRGNGAYVVWADAGDEVTFEIRCTPLGFSFGPRFQLLGADDRVLADGRAEVDADTSLTFTAPKAGAYRLMFDHTPNRLRVTADRPLGTLALDHLGNWGRLHLKRPVGRLYFAVPAELDRVELTVLGQGDGERVNAVLRDADGQVVEQREQISGNDPWQASVQREHSGQDEIWSLELDKPTDGYFGDVHLVFGDDLPPVVSPEPSAVFRLKK